MDIIDKGYVTITNRINNIRQMLIPHLRMLVRFIALPYAFFVLMNWDECKASRWQVLKDFIYIFFVLRDFPDYYLEFRFWEKDRSEWKYYYGSTYNPYQRGRLRRDVQKKEYEILFEDKHVCHQLCSYADIPVPEFLGYIQPADNFAQHINKLFENSDDTKIIIKASRGKGGADVFLAYKDKGSIIIHGNKQLKPIEEFKLESASIIQRFIKQHEALTVVSSSINTIRTETILTKGNEVEVIGAFIRFGIDGNFLDNQCAGGLSIGVDIHTGEMYEFALNSVCEKFYSHPDTGIKFKGLKIPFWDEVLSLSEKIQRSFPYYKLLGPDIAITPDGPVVIEINATPDHAGLEMDYGPTLNNKKVWDAFNEYDLFINKPSKNIRF